MSAVIHFARVAEASGVERIGEQERNLLALQRLAATFRPASRRTGLYAALKKKARDVVIAGLALGVQLKSGAYNRRFLFVHNNGARAYIIAIAERRDARVHAAPRFSAKPARDIRAQVAHILVRHAELNGHEKHIVVRKIDALMRDYFSYRRLLQHPTDAPAIYRIARQAIYLPAQNPLCFSALNSAHHIFKHGSPRSFRTPLFYELRRNIQFFAPRERAQLGELRLNRKDLFVLGVGTFASVEKITHNLIIQLYGRRGEKEDRSTAYNASLHGLDVY